MYKISAKTFDENCIHTISQLKRGKELILWLRMKDVERELDVENIDDLVDKKIKGKLIILQSNKLGNIKDMDQNYLKMKNLCKFMNAL